MSNNVYSFQNQPVLFNNTVSSSISSGTNLSLNNTSTSSQLPLSIYQPSLTTGNVSMNIGINSSSNNSGTIKFNYLGNGSTTNTLQLGLNGQNGFTIDGNNNIITNGTIINTISTGTNLSLINTASSSQISLTIFQSSLGVSSTSQIQLGKSNSTNLSGALIFTNVNSDTPSLNTLSLQLVGGSGFLNINGIGDVNISSTTASTTTSTGALIVNGGIGVAGNSNFGGILTLGNLVSALQVGNTSSPTFPTSIIIQNSGTAGLILGIAGDPGQYSTSSVQGDSVIRTTGGRILLGINGGNATAIINTGDITIIPTTGSSTSSTGALIVNGGIGVAGNSTFGGTLTLSQITGNTLVVSSTASSTSSVTVNSISTLGGIGVTGQSYFSNATASSSTSTGAVVVAGGIGVAGNSNFGGSLTVNGNGTFASTSAGIPPLSLTQNTTGSNDLFSLLSPNLPDTNLTSIIFGKANSFNNAGLIRWYSASTGSASNCMTFSIQNGAYSGANIMEIFNNRLSIPINTASSNTTTGAVVITGGIGIGGNSNIGGTLTLSQSTGNTLVVSSTASSTSSVTGNSISTLGGIGVTGQSYFSNATASSSTSTGAIVVAGGIGVGANSTFGGNLNITSLTASSAVATDASKNLISVTNTGTGNNVLQTTPTITSPNILSSSINLGGFIGPQEISMNLLNNTSGVSYNYYGFNSNTGNNAYIAYAYNGDNDPNNIFQISNNGTTSLSFYNSGYWQLVAPSALSSCLLRGAITLQGSLFIDNSVGGTGVLTISSLTASRGVATDASKNLISVYTPNFTTGTFSAVGVLTIPLDTTKSFVEISIYLTSSAVANITLRGNTASNGSGTNVAVSEPKETIVKASGADETTTSGIIAKSLEIGSSAGPAIFTVRMNPNNSVRNSYIVDTAYVYSTIGSSRVSASGHIPITINSIQLVPSTGSITGTWSARYY